MTRKHLANTVFTEQICNPRRDFSQPRTADVFTCLGFFFIHQKGVCNVRKVIPANL